jgi:hypothetical protein
MRWIISILGLALLTLAVGLKRRRAGETIASFSGLLSGVEDAVSGKTARGRELVREFFTFSDQILRWIFGSRLLSLRAAWTSAAVSLGAFLLGMLIFLGFGHLQEADGGSVPGASPIKSGLLLSIAIVIAAGLLPKIHKYAAALLWCLFAMWFLYALSVTVQVQAYGQGLAVGLGLAWICSSAGNLIAAWVLRRRMGMRTSQSFQPKGAFVAVTLLLAIGAALAPMAVSIVGVAVTPLGTWMRHSVPQFSAMSLMLTCVLVATNAVTACLAAACALVLVFAEFRRGAVAVVGHLLSPPAAQRLLHMQRAMFWAGLLLLLGPAVARLLVK